MKSNHKEEFMRKFTFATLALAVIVTTAAQAEIKINPGPQ